MMIKKCFFFQLQGVCPIPTESLQLLHFDSVNLDFILWFKIGSALVNLKMQAVDQCHKITNMTS